MTSSFFLFLLWVAYFLVELVQIRRECRREKITFREWCKSPYKKN